MTPALALLAAAAAAHAKSPHILYVLVDDYGWADAGWHRPGNWTDLESPRLRELVKEGVELDRHYVYQFCSPTRSAVQSGRNPIHVNGVNLDMSVWNPKDKESGYAGIPVHMTGMAEHMKKGGYDTHAYGKWDCGMATRHHTPMGRGYDTSLIYFHHANDYWTSKVGAYVDLWRTADGKEGPAWGMNNSWECSQDNQMDGCVYEDAMFHNEVAGAVQKWKPEDKPLFIFWAPHIVHTPLQVPQKYVDRFAFIDREERRLYHAMVDYVDEKIGEVADLLKAKGMWDDTLMVVHADNGGPVYQVGAAGANNYPLKGGKMSNWEGGIRVNAFASGGYLPQAVRGTKVEGLMCGWDWYATFASIAGVDPADPRAAAAGLPAVDGVNLWPYLSGAAAASPRTSIPIGDRTNKVTSTVSVGGLIDGRMKILVGTLTQSGWTGPVYPNTTGHWNSDTSVATCGRTPATGCLFDIFADPTEHVNLAAARPGAFRAMLAKLDEEVVFNPDRGASAAAASDAAKGRHQGFWGPFVFDV